MTRILGPHASAVLLDPEYSLPVIPQRSPQTGLLLANEKTGYDSTTPGRLPELLPTWSVRRLVEAGAHGLKVLLYYNPTDGRGCPPDGVESLVDESPHMVYNRPAKLA